MATPSLCVYFNFLVNRLNTEIRNTEYIYTDSKSSVLRRKRNEYQKHGIPNYPIYLDFLEIDFLVVSDRG